MDHGCSLHIFPDCFSSSFKVETSPQKTCQLRRFRISLSCQMPKDLASSGLMRPTLHLYLFFSVLPHWFQIIEFCMKLETRSSTTDLNGCLSNCRRLSSVGWRPPAWGNPRSVEVCRSCWRWSGFPFPFCRVPLESEKQCRTERLKARDFWSPAAQEDLKRTIAETRLSASLANEKALFAQPVWGLVRRVVLNRTVKWICQVLPSTHQSC